MNNKFKSILQELIDVPQKEQELFIESRAVQVIAATTNLIKLIESSYDFETADELKRRLFNSIKSNDVNKFKRKIHNIRNEKLRENHEKN